MTARRVLQFSAAAEHGDDLQGERLPAGHAARSGDDRIGIVGKADHPLVIIVEDPP